jgi:hypothetical protein
MICSKNWQGAKLVKDSTKNFLSDRIKKFVKCWNQSVEVKGDYVEKQ